MRQHKWFRKTSENTLLLPRGAEPSSASAQDPSGKQKPCAGVRSQEGTDPQTDRQTERQAKRCDGSSGVNPKGRRPSASGSRGEPRAKPCPWPLGYSYFCTGQRVKRNCAWTKVSRRAHLLPHTGLWLVPRLLFPSSPR